MNTLCGLNLRAMGRLATSSWDGHIRIYHGSTFELFVKRETHSGKQPVSVSFSPDGKLLAVGYNDSSAVDIFDGRNLDYLGSPDTVGVGDGSLSKVAWSQDGENLVSQVAEMLADGFTRFSLGQDKALAIEEKSHRAGTR